MGFPHSSVSKESACNAGDPGLIPGLGRSPGEGNGNPLQYSCLENPMDRGAWRATVYELARVGHNLATRLLLLHSGGSDSRESTCNAGDPCSISGSERSLGEGNGNSLQYSCLENPMDRGAWWATVHGIAESDMTERRHFHLHFFSRSYITKAK